jgi:hypothetical protein
MTCISIRKWSRKRSDRLRYFVCDGRQPAGTIFLSKNVYSAVSPDGRLVAVRENLKDALDALIGASS